MDNLTIIEGIIIYFRVVVISISESYHVSLEVCVREDFAKGNDAKDEKVEIVFYKVHLSLKKFCFI